MWDKRMTDYDIEDYEYNQDLLLCVDDEGFNHLPTQAERDNTPDLYS